MDLRREGFADERVNIAIEVAALVAAETGAPQIVFEDPETGEVCYAGESSLAGRLSWLNLCDVLWTSARGRMPSDLLDAEYKRLAGVQSG